MSFVEVQEYIKENYCNSISVQELAQQTHMSVRNFSRVFHKIYGLPPTAYVAQLRMKRACELLENPWLSVSEVAWACGFSDSNYFARQFKAASGCSPREYRKQIREKFS